MNARHIHAAASLGKACRGHPEGGEQGRAPEGGSSEVFSIQVVRGGKGVLREVN